MHLLHKAVGARNLPPPLGKAIDDAPDILPDAPPEFADLVSEPFDAAEYAWRPNAVGQQEWAVLQG